MTLVGPPGYSRNFMVNCLPIQFRRHASMLRRAFREALTGLGLSVLATFAVIASNPLGRVALAQDSIFENKKIVPFVPTPQEVVDKMVELAGVKKGDLVYDLGSGDGRIVITAAKTGAKAVGYEIDGDLVKQSRDNIRKASVQELAEIRQQDILTVDLSAASVVTMYLLPDVNLQLKPKILSSNLVLGWFPTPSIWVIGSPI